MGKDIFQPRKVVDVGVGVGSSSVALLDLVYERCTLNEDNYGYEGIEWVHGIDPSQSMRDGAQRVLSSVLEAYQNDSMSEGTNTGTTRTPNKTRITFGESLTGGTGRRDLSQSRGTFDLALCSYTLSEIPNIASNLALAAILWEKLNPNGVAIFIEPGTPDGFNSLRSARSMLLDCCPPPRPNDGTIIDDDNLDNRIGYEECHVIAPCTHNGACPMVRHRKDFLKEKGSKGGKTKAEFVQSNNEGEGATDDDWSEELLDDDDEEEEFDMDSDSDGDDDDDEDDVDNFYEKFDADSAGWEDVDGNESSFELGMSSDKKVEQATTSVFDSSFCSFIHGMPGGEGGKHGERFSYLVVQKRVTGESENSINSIAAAAALRHESNENDDSLSNVDIVDLLAQSMEARKTKIDAKESARGRELLQQAVEIEKHFIQSEEDFLGLELVKGNTHSLWGRIIRAPIKKKGHVNLDYCTSTTVQDDEMGDIEEGGEIIRQRVSQRSSERSAPGKFMAARKSRWGGLWPDIVQK